MQQRVLSFACFFIPIAIGSMSCFSQRYSFVNYTPKDGLVNSRVKSIFQDDKGRIYFLTYDGLSRYDGTRFENFTTENGLASEMINDIFVAGSDSFLVSTNTNKLNTLVKGKIGFYKTRDGFCPVINRFLKSKDGDLYVAADEGLFELKNEKFIRVILFPDSSVFKGHYLNNIIEWKNYLLLTVWDQTEKEKLILYNKATRKISDIFTGFVVYSIALNGTGDTVWTNTQKGSFILDNATLQEGKINLINKKYKEKTPRLTGTAYFDHENNVWLQNVNSLVKISNNGNYQIIGNSQGLQATNIISLFFDREGILWITTDGSGVFKMVNTNVSFINSLPGNDIINIKSVKCMGDTSWLYDVDKNAVICLAENFQKEYKLGTKIHGGNLLLNGKSIYINNDNAIYKIDDRNNSSSYNHLHKIFTLNYPGMVFGKIIIDPSGNLIANTKIDTSFFILTIRQDKKTFLLNVNHMVDQMVLDKQNRLWAITRANSLLVFTLHPDDPKNYLHLLKDYKHQLPAIEPRCMIIDISNNIWIGTRNNGIYRLEMDQLQLKNIRQLNMNDGITDNFIYSLACDKNNTIWAGTETGLDKIIYQNEKSIIDNVSKNNNIFQNVVTVDIDSMNTVWALCSQGSIIKVTNNKLQRRIITPSLLFTGIRINGLDVDINKSSDYFSYKQNSFSFQVAAPFFADEHSVMYSYMLGGGGNKEWSAPSNNASFNFLNLSPGNYKLHVKAKFPAMIYPEETIQYSFTIKPPWWQTWWFRIGIGISGIVLLVMGFRFYYSRKLEKEKVLSEKQQAIEKERTRIATDMHDDLGAGLSRIKFLSETIGIKKQKQEPIEEDISKIREYAHEMIDKMGEIVWALNEKNDSLSDLLSYTRAYTTEYLVQNGISCIVEAPEIFPSNFVTGEFRRNIFLTIKEALHNVVKHAQANQVKMKITVTKQLQVYIEDDGIGFDKNHIRPFSNGLNNMKHRMELINGTIELESERGTIIKLSAPL